MATDTNTSTLATSAVVARPQGFVMRVLTRTSGFLLLLGAYILFKLIPELPYIPDLDWRATVAVGNYGFASVDLFYIAIVAAALRDLERVSHPGVDNTHEAREVQVTANVMMGLFIVGVVLNLVIWLGWAPVDLWIIDWISRAFSSTEFLVLMVVVQGTAPICYKVNARTLKRTIDYGAHEGS